MDKNKIKQFLIKNKFHLIFSCLLIYFILNTVPLIDDNIFTGNTDPSEYLKRGTEFANGVDNSIDDYFSPGYMILLGLWMKLFGISVVSAKILSLISAIFLMVTIYIITNVTFKNHWISIITSLFFIYDPFVRFYAINVYKELPFALLLSTLVLIPLVLVNIKLKENYKYSLYFIFGIIAGISVYFNSWIYATLIFILYPLYETFIKKQLSIKKGLTYVGLTIGGLFVSILLMNIFFFIPIHGEPVYFLSNGGLLLYYGNNPTSEANVAFTSRYTDITNEPLKNFVESDGRNMSLLTRSEKSSYATKYVLSFWLNNPGYLINRVSEFLFSYWLYPNNQWSQRFLDWDSVKVYLWLKWILILVGLTKVMLMGITRFLYLIAPMCLVSGVYGLTNYLMRYKMYILPIQLIFASVGLYFIIEFIYYIIKDFVVSDDSVRGD